MFRRLNNQLFRSCVNALTTDKIRRNYLSSALYFSPLLDPTPAYPGPTIAGGHAGGLDHPPARPPAYVGGWSVGQSVMSNFTHYSGAQIHSLGGRAF